MGLKEEEGRPIVVGMMMSEDKLEDKQEQPVGDIA